MKTTIRPLLSALCGAMLSGCITPPPPVEPEAVLLRPDSARQEAPAFPLRAPESAPETPETGTVRFTADAEYLYVFFTLNDRDIVADCKKDQQPLYQYGDTVELFLKPEDSPEYWELHVDPNGNRTSIHFPGRSYSRLKSREWPAALPGFRAVAHRTETGWSAKLAVPWQELGGRERRFRVLAGRYNYGRELDQVAHSSFPRLSRPSFHQYECYLPLQWSQQENNHAN